jgi:hypothetical protein
LNQAFPALPVNAAHRAFAILRAGFAIATALVDLGRWQLDWESLEKHLQNSTSYVSTNNWGTSSFKTT